MKHVSDLKPGLNDQVDDPVAKSPCHMAAQVSAFNASAQFWKLAQEIARPFDFQQKLACDFWVSLGQVAEVIG